MRSEVGMVSCGVKVDERGTTIVGIVVVCCCRSSVG
jgi:hypothetical protein